MSATGMTPHQVDAAALRAIAERLESREEGGTAALLFFAAGLVEDGRTLPPELVRDATDATTLTVSLSRQRAAVSDALLAQMVTTVKPIPKVMRDMAGQLLELRALVSAEQEQ